MAMLALSFKKPVALAVRLHDTPSSYGVALLSRQAPQNLVKGFPWDGEDSQRRFIGATFSDEQGRPLHVFNGYFPQGESRAHPLKFPAKTQFYADLQRLLEEQFTPEQAVVEMGDFNISPQDLDTRAAPTASKPRRI